MKVGIQCPSTDIGLIFHVLFSFPHSYTNNTYNKLPSPSETQTSPNAKLKSVFIQFYYFLFGKLCDISIVPGTIYVCGLTSYNGLQVWFASRVAPVWFASVILETSFILAYQQIVGYRFQFCLQVTLFKQILFWPIWQGLQVW